MDLEQLNLIDGNQSVNGVFFLQQQKQLELLFPRNDNAEWCSKGWIGQVAFKNNVPMLVRVLRERSDFYR